jgi:SAM-dependent methyltransferase
MNVALYRLTQSVLGPDAAHEVMRRTARIPRRGRHLDVGGGPASWLWREGLKPIGVDLAADRAAAYGIAVSASAAALPFAGDSFDVSWSFGLLHHLCDRDVRLTIAELRRVTRPGGHVVIFDGVLPERPFERPLASLIRRMDRGRWLRRQEALESLLDRRDAWTLERFTYTATGLEGVLCACRA